MARRAGCWRSPDPRVGAAIQAIHADPARVWTVEALAEVAGVSRSTLALHFKRKAGIARAGILAALAHATGGARADRQPGDDFLGRAELGYDSDSAFSHAFKRVMGSAPSVYRRPPVPPDGQQGR